MSRDESPDHSLNGPTHQQSPMTHQRASAAPPPFASRALPTASSSLSHLPSTQICSPVRTFSSYHYGNHLSVEDRLVRTLPVLLAFHLLPSLHTTLLHCDANALSFSSVTGANGFIASHLVKQLLERGYTVHGTVRDPSDGKKTSHLKVLPGAEDRLKLYKADLYNFSGMRAAISGCGGLFFSHSHLSVANSLSHSPQPPISCKLV